MSGPLPRIDRGAARRRFERAAKTYAQASRLEAEVGTRMLERLDYVKLAPRRILDAGSGPPQHRLGKRYPGAEVVALDFSLGMLRSSRFGFFRKKPFSVCADLQRLPLADASVDLVWCNMTLHWLADPLAAFREFHRALGGEGLLMFSTLGPDTLKELRVAAGEARVHPFIDMHDLGDMLVGAGFSAPVMDMEMIRMEYGRDKDLLADLRRSGQTSTRADRPRGLAGRGFGARLRENLAPRATFECVYGHAWKSRPPSREAAAQTAKTVRVFKRLP